MNQQEIQEKQEIQDERITQLEIKLSYLEDFVTKLQEVAVAQSGEIERLKTENRLLVEKMHDVIEYCGDDIPNRKPPHY